jgi:RNase E specificity factor CsrD
VIAEGVECFEEWQTLKILGVSAAQGEYLDQITER